MWKAIYILMAFSLVTITTLHHNINPLKVSTQLSTSVAAYEVNFNFDYQGQNIFSDPGCRLCGGSQWIAEHHWQWPGPVLHAAQVPVLGWAGADGVVCSGQCEQERWDEEEDEEGGGCEVDILAGDCGEVSDTVGGGAESSWWHCPGHGAWLLWHALLQVSVRLPLDLSQVLGGEVHHQDWRWCDAGPGEHQEHAGVEVWISECSWHHGVSLGDQKHETSEAATLRHHHGQVLHLQPGVAEESVSGCVLWMAVCHHTKVTT